MWELASDYPWLIEGDRPAFIWEIDGKQMVWFPEGQHTVIARIRRGKYVRIPAEWRGKTTVKPTIRKRPSKQGRKRRRRMKNGHGERFKGEKRAPTVESELSASMN